MVNVQNEPFIIQPENQFASNKPCFSITNVMSQRVAITVYATLHQIPERSQLPLRNRPAEISIGRSFGNRVHFLADEFERSLPSVDNR